jgi:hypothetical protein
MLVPFFAWALTGLVFFIKPGYAGAYEILSPRTYPLDQQALSLKSDPSWREVRYLRTVLGDHLIVRSDAGWTQLNPSNYQPRQRPTHDELKLLVKDAFAVNPSRYGDVAAISGDTIRTTTAVEINLNWDTLSFQQRGRDTDRIDLLYKIHYLQWTGIKSVDKVLGVIGLGLVILLTSLGAWLAFKRG